MNYKDNDHTFAICAYKNSKYLEKCIQSLENQTLKTNIIMVTSTPSDYISNIAAKHRIPLFINEGESGIAGDWNYAYSMSNTRLVTIAHQDDVYSKEYAFNMVNYANKVKKPIIIFSDYGEIREGVVVKSNKLLRVKRLMLMPLLVRPFWNIRFIRRMILSFGSPICCPSVCYVKENLPEQLFIKQYKGAVDWQAWERFSRLKGAFIYIPIIHCLHRIHEESETSRIIEDSNRSKEDLEMFKKFWPEPVAKLLEHFYNKGEESNSL